MFYFKQKTAYDMRISDWSSYVCSSDLGQIDTVINILYVVLLGTVGALMGRESLQTMRRNREGARPRAAKRRHHPLVASLPMRWRFYRSGLYISPLAPLLMGVVVGILTMPMGVGGGFILVPAMLYILGMSASVVVGTSLFQILFVTMAATMMHSLTTKAVDIVLAGLLLFGSVTGAQLGTRMAQLAKPELLRLLLAATVLAVALRMRSEEHTSELQSLMRISSAVFCLKKNKPKIEIHDTNE